VRAGGVLAAIILTDTNLNCQGQNVKVKVIVLLSVLQDGEEAPRRLPIEVIDARSFFKRLQQKLFQTSVRLGRDGNHSEVCLR
jgi:hypothetical protein